jgi:PhnB protein
MATPPPPATAASPSRAAAVIPYLAYADATKAIDFLCRAFGFEERFRYPMPDGSIGHAELGLGASRLMLATASESFGLASPRDLPLLHAQIYCRIDDADAHFARARDAGATIVEEPSNQHGARIYRALDPEGHRWIFAAEKEEEAP